MMTIAVTAAIVGLGLRLLTLIAATVLCRRALRDGGEFEAEFKFVSLAYRMRATYGERPRKF
jgi:hypothetical protein